ncbi:OsmC family protein [Pontibacter sp. MBLB2868]|uniref:OsmC family protein n=1 Tax=Pontibacter sp. MBLB2868 TaxID=3451555 RepID=UPI003F752C6C
MKRKATAVWQGTIKEGKGHLSTQTGTLNQSQYSFNSRFADGIGTNPEELIAAAHSGCFTMKLSGNLTEAGFDPERLETQCTITLENGTITSSHLEVHATVSGIEKEKFDELVHEAEKNCPVSKLLKADISVSSKLNE